MHLSNWNIYGSESHGLFATRKPDTSDVQKVWITTDPLVTNLKWDRRLLGIKEYEMKDHSGNVRLVFSDRKTPTDLTNYAPYSLEVRSLNNYYSFGSIQSEQSYQSGKSRYGFNGKEQDREIKGEGSSYDFGARMYNADYGRFFTPDPMKAKYANLSPYTSFANNPIIYIDPDGRDYEVSIIHSENGGTIVIKASYYTIVDQESSSTKYVINQGTEFWNQQSSKFQYVIGEGDNKKVYDIKFELTKTKSDENNKFLENQPIANNVQVIEDDEFQKLPFMRNAGGNNLRDNVTVSDEYSGNYLVAAHELGHSIGIEHFRIGLMTKNVKDLKPFVFIENIETMLGKIGIGPQKELQKNVDKNNSNTIGIPVKVEGMENAPSDFENGTIKEKEN